MSNIYKGSFLAYHAGNVDVEIKAASDSDAITAFSREMDEWERDNPNDLILREHLENPAGELIL